MKEITGILEQAEKEFINTSKSLYYVYYWKAYLSYKHSFLILKNNDLNEQEKKVKIKNIIEKGLEGLNNIENKNSETYSLLALLISMKYIYTPRQNILQLMNENKKALEFSMIDGENNTRAYYVNASYDFYTPKQYGGGKKAESLLLKAISIKEKIRLPIEPKWGKKRILKTFN
ncbi:hypothetical protein [Ichthyobacterium seriolicida]|nr:hypothetical protein [Ichthyobacterium seriolicida]